MVDRPNVVILNLASTVSQDQFDEINPTLTYFILTLHWAKVRVATFDLSTTVISKWPNATRTYARRSRVDRLVQVGIRRRRLRRVLLPALLRLLSELVQHRWLLRVMERRAGGVLRVQLAGRVPVPEVVVAAVLGIGLMLVVGWGWWRRLRVGCRWRVGRRRRIGSLWRKRGRRRVGRRWRVRRLRRVGRRRRRQVQRRRLMSRRWRGRVLRRQVDGRRRVLRRRR